MKKIKLKNYHLYAKAISLLSMSALIFSFQNCKEQTFTSLSSESNTFTTNTGGPSCREVLQDITTPIEFIFVVDVSGSNDDYATTDPDKSIRAGSINRFLGEYQTKTNFDWTFISFGNDSVDLRASNSDPIGMQMALDWFMDHDDNGNTPYGMALDSVHDFLDTELNNSPTDTKYIVVFLSDGRPNPDISDETLETSIKGLLNKAPDNLSFNTVYYGPYDEESHDRLEFMAEVGGGHFLDTNDNSTGSAFNIGDLVVVPPVTLCN